MFDPIAVSVPLFVVAIGVEAFVAHRRGIRAYRLADTVTDLSCGVASQLEGVAFMAAQLGVYAWFYAHRVTTLHGWLAWAVAFVGVDFLYYWWHRLSHEVNFLWAAHVVHHQSEDYNLAVALRQSITTGWSALPFYLPLALAGVSTEIFAFIHALSIVYQFWFHTRLVGKVRGVLDYVVNLPHHHRVHHAINPQYLDKNYGATLIVWDRLFGTYAEENEPCVYGITKPLASFNPLWAQLHFFIELAQQTLALRGADRLRVWVASPAWKPRGAKDSEPVDLGRPQYDVALTSARKRYVGAQFAVLLAAMSVVILARGLLPRASLIVVCVGIGAGLVSLGGVLERTRWAAPLECARLATLVAGFALALR
jgi:hypothetical protein